MRFWECHEDLHTPRANSLALRPRSACVGIAWLRSGRHDMAGQRVAVSPLLGDYDWGARRLTSSTVRTLTIVTFLISSTM